MAQYQLSQKRFYWCQSVTKQPRHTHVWFTVAKIPVFDITANMSPYGLLKHAGVLLFVHCCVRCQIYCKQCAQDLLYKKIKVVHIY